MLDTNTIESNVTYIRKLFLVHKPYVIYLCQKRGEQLQHLLEISNLE